MNFASLIFILINFLAIFSFISLKANENLMLTEFSLKTMVETSEVIKKRGSTNISLDELLLMEGE